jgi:hypothetical protein
MDELTLRFFFPIQLPSEFPRGKLYQNPLDNKLYVANVAYAYATSQWFNQNA